jgi:hypothetical protein
LRLVAGGAECWDQPDRQPNQRGNAESEREDRAVDGDRADARQFRWTERHQRANAQLRNNHASHAARCCEKQALRQQLPDQPAAPGAERSAQSELAATPHRSSQQQIGHVYGGDY